ncbi:MAG TPA: type II CAAX endopeptidase family protein [Symbiobacteriaceae bacterium]|nr:type II CAAX endopeptidase family protein [Symbiobacteriaceae bacterium]
MSNESRAQRLRLLLIAGVAAPVLMTAGGWLLLVLARRPVPDLLVPVTALQVLVGLLAAGASMGLIGLLYRIHPALERALRRSGGRVGIEAIEVAGYPIMLVIVTASAFGEEMLFRGALQPVIGLVPAALLFGFSHGGWRKDMWAYVLAASISGLIFGAVLHLTGSMWVPVIAHAVHNVFSTLLMGKKVEVTRDGWLPRVRLIPDPRDFEEIFPPEPPAEEPTEVPADVVDEPVPPEADSPEPGPDDGDSADREPQ